MASVSIENLIATNFTNHQKSINDEEFQRCRNDVHDTNTISTSVSTSLSTSESLRKQILDHVLNAKDVSTEMETMQNEISTTLEYIMGATLTNIVQQKSTSLASFKSSPIYDSTMMVLDLVSHFVCSKGDGSLATEVVEFMGKFAAVELECVRAIVCEFMGWSVQYLYSGTVNVPGTKVYSKANSRLPNVPFLLGCNSKEEEFEWREECTTLIKSFLIDRLQDKSQAVRQLAIEACGYLYMQHPHTNVNSSNSSSTHSQRPDQDNIMDMNELDLFNPELHEDITEALLWNISHDPSFANRSMALQSVPIVIDTIPAIVERVRDAKLKVRVDALEVLTTKVSIQQLSNEQRANILRDGLSTRYPATYAATTKMLCCGWIKRTKFDPIALLDLLDPIQHENVCLNAAKAIIATASKDYEMEGVLTTSDVTLGELSNPEIRAYKEKVLGTISITNPNAHTGDSANGEEERELDPASMIFIRARCEMILESKTLNEYKKSTRLAEIVPDVTVLGQVIGKHVKALNDIVEEKNSLEEEIDEDDDYDDDIIAGYDHREDIEVFICLHLLKLSKFVDLKEEGSRRHFSSIIHRILCNPDTHADLVEGAVHALSASHDNEAAFLLSISEVLASIIETDTDTGADEGEGEDGNDANGGNGGSPHHMSKEEKTEQYLRAIEILSVALEKTSRKMSSNAILRNFNSTILNAITTPSLGPLVRESGVSCLGRYVILMDEETIIDTFKPVLMGIAFGEDEKIEIRAQAMLAISDLAFMFHRIMAPIALQNITEEEVAVTDLLLKMLSQPKKSLAIVAAECSAKLLFTGKMHDANIVAHLVTMYFDKNLTFDADEEDDAVKEVGSPTRLAQLLTIFFPAYSMGSAIGRDTLTACIKPLLGIVHNKMSMKVKGRKNPALPIAKMVEYICQTIENGEDAAAKSSNDDDGNETDLKDASPVLNVAVAICYFLCDENENLTISYLRSLCKILSKSYIDIDSEDIKTLKHLKRGLDELSINITDNTAMRSLETLIEILDDVQSDEEEDDEQVETENDESEDEEESVDKRQHKHDDVGDTESSTDTLDDKQMSYIEDRKENESVPLFATMGSDDLGDTESSTDTLDDTQMSYIEDRKDNESVPLFATMGRQSNTSSTSTSASGQSSRISKDSDIPLFASAGNHTNPERQSSNSKVLRRGSRKAEIPLFASIGSNNNGRSNRDSSEFESQSESDEVSSSSYESDDSDFD